MKRIAYAAALTLLIGACSSAHHSAVPASSTSARPLEPTAQLSTSVPCSSVTHHYSQAQLDTLRGQVSAMIPDQAFGGVGIGLNAIGVQLKSGQEAVAAKLEARFGNAVQITVGLASYHCGIGLSRKCPALTGATNLPPGLHLTLKLDAPSIPATGSEGAKLTVVEDQSTPLQMDTGSLIVASIVKPGTRTVIATYGGPIAGTGLGFNLRDGQHTTLNTIVGAWRCDGEPGSTIPPGTYAVRAGISRNEGPPDYLAPEVPLTITG